MAEKSQASNGSIVQRKEEWEDLWAASGRAERIAARVQLGKEALELEKQIGRRRVLELLASITGDRSRAHQVLRVAKLRKKLIDYAKRQAEKGNRMSWTHLAFIALIAKREDQQEIARKCVHSSLSVAKLKQMLADDYAYVPWQGKIRVTELSTAFERELRTVTATTAQILANDEGESFIEATKLVKPKHQDRAARQLGEALKHVQNFMSDARALKKCLTKAKQRLENFREVSPEASS